MALPEPIDLWYKTDESNKWRKLSGVTDYKRSRWWVCKDAYRDTGWDHGTVPMQSSGSPSAVPAVGIPVVGVATRSVVPNSFGALKHASADEHLHILHRPKWEIRTGYLIAMSGSVPTHTVPIGAVSVNLNAGTDTFTTSGDDVFASGDIVTMSAATLPAGASGDVLYMVMHDDASPTTLRLIDFHTGEFVNFAPVGGSVNLTLVEPAPLLLTSTLLALPDALNPLLSTSDPTA